MAKQMPLEVYSCPKFPLKSALIRLLAGPRGVLTHHDRGKPRGCPGEELCKLHDIRPTWKGYAPGQIWDLNKKLWIPKVIEFTSGLMEFTGTEDLRGTVWRLHRADRTYGKKAVEGELISRYDSHDLPAAFRVENTVCKLLNTEEILWDVPVDAWSRDTAECSDDPPPAGENKKSPERPERGQGYADFERQKKKLADKMNGTL